MHNFRSEQFRSLARASIIIALQAMMFLGGCEGCGDSMNSSASDSCAETSCSLNEECILIDGQAECQCQSGYVLCDGLCIPSGSQCTNPGTSPSDSGLPPEETCSLGEIQCIDAETQRECVESSPAVWEEEECEFDCIDGEGCSTQTCDPEDEPYCLNLYTVVTCEEPGTEGVTEMMCSTNHVCIDGACVAQVCTPNLIYCEDNEVRTCNDLGTAFTATECAENSECYQGQCINTCELAVLTESYIGCEYFAADLSNSARSSSNNRSYALAFANTNDALEAVVTVRKATVIDTQNTDSLDFDNYTIVDTVVVPPGDVQLVEIPKDERDMNLHDNGATGFSTPGGNGVWERLYHVSSTAPIVTYQFNPLETIGSASSDASLVLPSHVLDTQYFILGYGPSGSATPNFVVYATQPDTTVTVDVSVETPSSNNQSLVDFDTLSPGQPLTLTLQPMQALNLFCRNDSCDFTGTAVTADKPIGVFAGGRGRVPSNIAYTDMMEEQLLPRQKWGQRYIIPKSRDRWGIEDRVRIMADQDNTNVHFVPDTFVTTTLAEGEWIEISLFESLYVESDKPIQIGQYLAGSQYGDNPWSSGSEGDPSFWVVPPTEQFRNEYVFYVPSTYTSDYLAVMFQGEPELVLDGDTIQISSTSATSSDGGTVSDGGAIDAGTIMTTPVSPIAPGTDYFVLTIPISDGAHALSSTLPVGLIIYGFGGPSELDPNGVQNVSYGYVGGLNLGTINPKE